MTTTTSGAINVRAFESTADRLLAVMQLAVLSGQDWISAVALSTALRADHGVQVHWRTIDAELNGTRDLVARRKLQATRQLHDVLAQLSGTVRICDAYLDNTTFEHLEACPKTADVRLLTMNIKDSGPLRRIVAAARTAGHKIEIKIVGNRVLHDRYVIDDTRMLILGTSLNGFGKKQSFVINAGDDIRATMEREFDALWLTAATWP